MSDRSLHQRIKKFSKFITTKVKEKTLHKTHDDDEEEDDTALERNAIIRRHSSYIQQPTPTTTTAKEEDQVNFFDNSRFKQEGHYHTIPPHYKLTNSDNMISPTSTDSSTTSALSPPPRHSKKDRQKSLNSINYQNRYSSPQVAAKPCLSRSNTLGHHPTTPSIKQYHNTTPPDLSSTISVATPIHVTNHTSFSTSNSSTSLSSLSGRCDLGHSKFIPATLSDESAIPL